MKDPWFNTKRRHKPLSKGWRDRWRKGQGDADGGGGGGGLQQSGWEGQERDKIAFPGNEDGHHGNCSWESHDAEEWKRERWIRECKKKSRQRAGLLALPADDKGGEGGSTDGGGKRGSGTSVAIWFICSPPDYSDVMCVLSEKRNDKGYSGRGDEEGWGRWRGKSSPKIGEKQEQIIIKDLFRLKSNTSTRVQVEWPILLFVYENLLFCFFVHFTFVRFWNCGADWEIIPPSSWCEHVCTGWFVI